MATLGNYIIVKWNAGGTLTAIAASKSCTLTNMADVKEISSQSSSTARNYVAGRTGWRVTCNYLVTDVSDLLKVRNTYTLNIMNPDGTGLQGSAILTTCEITATHGNIAAGSFVFQGSGDLVNMTIN